MSLRIRVGARPATVVAALLLAGLVARFLGAPPALGQATGAGSDVPPGIVRLLEARSGAYTTGDRGLLEGTLAEGIRGREVGAFEASRGVALEAYAHRVSTQFSGDIATPRVRALHEGADVLAYHVVIESQVAGVETVPYVDNAFYTFARRGPTDDPYDGWRLASTTDFDPLGIHSPRQLWDGGEVRGIESPHFLFLVHPAQEEELRAVVDQAEAAYREVAGFWPRDVRERYVVLVPSSTDELQEMIRATVDLTKFVAFAARTFHLEEGWEPAGTRLFLNLPNFRRYGPGGRQAIFAHELIHAITTPLSGPQTPVWVEEGLAEVATGTDERLQLARRGPAPDRFPPDEAFRIGPTADIVRTYGLAQAAMEELRDRSGVEAMVRFYEAVGSARVAAGTGEYHVAWAANEALGWSVDAWEAAWRARLS